MKKFKDFLAERQKINYTKKVEVNHSGYDSFSKSILLEMGVQSPTELSSQKYEVYLSKLKDFNKGTTYSKVSEEETTPKKFSLTEKQKENIQAIVNTASTLLEAKESIDNVFSKKMPNFKGAKNTKNSKGLDTLVLEFDGVEYSFVKNSINEGKIDSKEKFKKALEAIYKKAHEDDYDQKIVDKVYDDLMKDLKDNNFQELMGRATSGLGQ